MVSHVVSVVDSFKIRGVARGHTSWTQLLDRDLQKLLGCFFSKSIEFLNNH